ncbi:PGPGW domain-containing protein [Pseudonocardia halophobica]|uniref:PGPGW domain-containing protein n=1 Tax=Pseudonocardia halophobica TaxID=29401 RepID=UPI003D8D67D9
MTSTPLLLGAPSRVPHGGLRHRIRSRPGLALAYRVAVFVAGLLCIASGLALSVLPGPLTIPPVLLGLWVWSTEFAWAQRLFRRFQVKARQAWQHARTHPVSSSAITLGGLVVVAVGVWALRHFEIVARVRDALGL